MAVYTFSYRCKLIPENHSCTGILSGKYYAPDALDASVPNFIQQTNLIESFANHEGCTLFFNLLLYLFTYPPCDVNTSELLPLCTERCPESYRLFEGCGVIIDFNCSIPTTYYDIAAPHVKVSTTYQLQ